MIPLLDNYELIVPGSLHDVVEAFVRYPHARPFAGGTDLMVLLEAGHLPPGRYISLQNCRELHGISDADDGGVKIGALTTYTDISRSARLTRDYPLLGSAARETGGGAPPKSGPPRGATPPPAPPAATPPPPAGSVGRTQARSPPRPP